MPNCKICGIEIKPLFKTKLLKKYITKFFICSRCGFIQTSKPEWLEEAYDEALNVLDTGAISRNLAQSRITARIISNYFDENGKFVDYGGGYGVFTRMMRDKGYDFYWSDKYANNLYSRGFEYTEQKPVELITSFECFEHFPDPLNEIIKMLSISENILFSTELYKGEKPSRDWWYWGFEHGQHISFYSIKTLDFIANKYELNLYTDGHGIHLFTRKNLPISKYDLTKIKLPLSEKLGNYIIYYVNKLLISKHQSLKSKTMDDHLMLKKEMGKK